MPDEDKQTGAADQKYRDRVREIMDYADSVMGSVSPMSAGVFSDSPLLDRLNSSPTDRVGGIMGATMKPTGQLVLSAPRPSFGGYTDWPGGQYAITSSVSLPYSTDWITAFGPNPSTPQQPARPEPPPSKPLLVEFPTDRKIRFADG